MVCLRQIGEHLVLVLRLFRNVSLTETSRTDLKTSVRDRGFYHPNIHIRFEYTWLRRRNAELIAFTAAEKGLFNNVAAESIDLRLEARAKSLFLHGLCYQRPEIQPCRTSHKLHRVTSLGLMLLRDLVFTESRSPDPSRRSTDCLLPCSDEGRSVTTAALYKQLNLPSNFESVTMGNVRPNSVRCVDLKKTLVVITILRQHVNSNSSGHHCMHEGHRRDGSQAIA
jgi:hypothetical protein